MHSIALGEFNNNAAKQEMIVGAFRQSGGAFPNPDEDAVIGSANALRGAVHYVEVGAATARVR